MFNLNDTLGLNNIPADPNDIPDGKYDGIVLKSEYVYNDTKNQVSHVLTLQVSDGTHKGAQKQHWYNLGKNCVTAQGTKPTNINEVAGFESLMTDQNKTWYKKMWVSLGVPEEAVGTASPEVLKGKLVVFGVKRNAEGYKNVNFIDSRKPGTVNEMSAQAVPQSLAPVGTPQVATPAPQVNPFDQPATGLPQF